MIFRFLLIFSRPELLEPTASKLDRRRHTVNPNRNIVHESALLIENSFSKPQVCFQYLHNGTTRALCCGPSADGSTRVTSPNSVTFTNL